MTVWVTFYEGITLDWMLNYLNTPLLLKIWSLPQYLIFKIFCKFIIIHFGTSCVLHNIIESRDFIRFSSASNNLCYSQDIVNDEINGVNLGCPRQQR